MKRLNITFTAGTNVAGWGGEEGEEGRGRRVGGVKWETGIEHPRLQGPARV